MPGSVPKQFMNYLLDFTCALSKMSPAGFEPTTYGLKVPGRSNTSSGFQKAHETDAQLADLVNGWASFSLTKRAAILAIANAQLE